MLRTFEEVRAVKVLIFCITCVFLLFDFALQVVVFPLGPNTLFDKQFQLLSNVREVPFYEINRPQIATFQTQPFKYFNWNDGNILFDFTVDNNLADGPNYLSDFKVCDCCFVFSASLLYI